MKLQFCGAAGTVTGSCYILTSASGQPIMIDCGMFQGTKILEAMNTVPIDYEVSQLSGMVLTHAHLDHCGRIPMIVKRGFSAPIFMTGPTRDITEISLFDTAKIAKFDTDKAVLYVRENVEDTIRLFRTVAYGKAFFIGDFEVIMRDAGHILGSASLEIIDHSDPNQRTIVFSGDLGNTPQDLIEPTERIQHADIVVMESTYGDETHPSQNPSDVLTEEVNTIEEQGGTLLIPAFSIERSQEILHRLMHLKADGRVKNETKIFFDSPMGEKVTQVFRSYPSWWNDELRKDNESGDPFTFPGLEVLDRREQSQGAQEVSEPKVIIAGSGMMSGGRIVHHAQRFLGEASTRLLLVGYQGEETLGRELAEGAKQVVIEQTQIMVRASVTQTRSMSSHADQPKLMNWLSAMNGTTKVILTHGENGPRQTLAEKIHAELSLSDIEQPILNQTIEF